MKEHYALWWWTLDRETPTPWQKRCVRSEMIEGKRRHLFVAIIEETSLERAWEHVFRCFPDYRDHKAVKVDPECTVEKLAQDDHCRRR